MARRMYPETRSHFSMAFLLGKASIPIGAILKSYPPGERVVKGKAFRTDPHMGNARIENLAEVILGNRLF
jgi:hypothetical protein